VLLEPQQRVGLSFHRGLGEHPGRLLEGCRGEPRLGRERSLGDTHDFLAAFGRTLALEYSRAAHRSEARTVDELARKQLGVTVVDDSHLAEHLANDDLDVLVVDRHTLRAVDALHTVNEVLLHGTDTLDAKNFLRVEVTDVQLGTELDVLAVLDEEGRTTQHRVRHWLVTIVWCEDQAATTAVVVFDRDDTVSL